MGGARAAPAPPLATGLLESCSEVVKAAELKAFNITELFNSANKLEKMFFNDITLLLW